ncbi:MAG: hypothetical protein WC456_01145 [Patescibacteria group bacterium]
MERKHIQLVVVGQTGFDPGYEFTLTPIGKGQINKILNSGQMFPRPAAVIAGAAKRFADTAYWLNRKITDLDAACHLSAHEDVKRFLLKPADANEGYSEISRDLYELIRKTPNNSLLIIDGQTVNCPSSPSAHHFSPGTLIQIETDEDCTDDRYLVLVTNQAEIAA